MVSDCVPHASLEMVCVDIGYLARQVLIRDDPFSGNFLCYVEAMYQLQRRPVELCTVLSDVSSSE